MMALFADRWLAAAALGAPLLVLALLALSLRRRRRRLARFGDAALVRRLAPADVSRALAWRAARLGLVAALAAIALLGPRWGEEHVSRSAEGADVVLVVDVSLSMLANDDRPSRLERVRAEIRRLRASGVAHRFALIAFAGRSYVLTPLTTDAGALDLYLEHLDPSVAGQPGSAIAPALKQAVDLLLAAHSSADRALVLFTDGESWEDDAAIDLAARNARENDVRVITVGFGTVRGSAIPEVIDGRRDWHRNRDGEVVISRAHPEVLEAIARASNGTVIPPDLGDRSTRIRGALADLRTAARAEAGVVQAQARFQWFLLPAVLLLLWDALASDGRGRWRRGRSASRAARVPLAAGALLVLAAPQDRNRPPAAPPADTADTPAVGTQGPPRARGAGDSTPRRDARSSASYKAAQDVFDLRVRIRAGDHRPETLYNLGTALLAADSIAGAILVLDPLTRAERPEVRRRAQFNLALAHLRRGRAGDAQELGAAAELYKKYLLAHPADADAKWNYELALRDPQGGAGAGGPPPPPRPQEQQQPEQAPATPQGSLDRRQAEQLLDNAARDERDVQGRRQKRAAGEPPRVEKDW